MLPVLVPGLVVRAAVRSGLALLWRVRRRDKKRAPRGTLVSSGALG